MNLYVISQQVFRFKCPCVVAWKSKVSLLCADVLQASWCQVGVVAARFIWKSSFSSTCL